MKKYNIQNRSQKNSHSCVPLRGLWTKHNWYRYGSYFRISFESEFIVLAEGAVGSEGFLKDSVVYK